MIVIADTSPINYLILIGQIDVLRALYGRVLIPPTQRTASGARDRVNSSAGPEEHPPSHDSHQPPCTRLGHRREQT